MNIVTTADSGFAHCLKGLAESVIKYYGKNVIVYDLGLTEEQKRSINADIIPIDVHVDFRNYATFSKQSNIQLTGIKATHKPFCVSHYFQNFTEPMIFLDADCAFNQKVEETGFDVGVTLRRKGRVDLTNTWIGILNSGVVFFNTYAKELVEEWQKRCQSDNTTDQKELTEILSETIDWKHYNKIYDWHGIKVKVFDAGTYNDERLKNGKIFHFKGKRHEKGMYEKLIHAQKEGENAYELFNQLTGRQKKTGISKMLNKITGFFGN